MQRIVTQCNVLYCSVTYVCTHSVCLYVDIHTQTHDGWFWERINPRFHRLELQTNESNPIRVPNTSAARRPRSLSQAWHLLTFGHPQGFTQKNAAWSWLNPASIGYCCSGNTKKAVCFCTHFPHPNMAGRPCCLSLFTHDHIWVVRLGHRSTS